MSNRGLFIGPLEPAFAEDERLRFVPSDTRAAWFPTTPSLMLGDAAAQRRRYATLLRMVTEMHAAGVRFLAGTDLGVAHVYAGSSLHDELELLVGCGLSSGEALAAATRHPAEALGMLDRLGTIEVGKLADLVLLAGDPLEDIGNTRRVEGVVLNGRWLDRWALDGLLEQAQVHADEPR